ncbi:peptidase S8/S53 domain-containing protein [Hypoxylon cercidicola]|nr:peptidase S8/S53 domain-containing protein [Hypoxylon cercidicola]
MESTADSWQSQLIKIGNSIESISSTATPSREIRIKIAVLGTGYHKGGHAPYDERIIDSRWQDFTKRRLKAPNHKMSKPPADKSRTPIDEDRNQHGSKVVRLVLEMAPHADVFVCRVVEKEGYIETETAVDGVVKAINHAAREWNVDIVIMAFGSRTSHESISNAISHAQDIRGGRIVFFAPAGYEDIDGNELFPACLPSVISVRGTDLDGTFIPAYDPPRPKATEGSTRLYGTLGENVETYPGIHKGGDKYYVHLWVLFDGALDESDGDHLWATKAAEQIYKALSHTQPQVTTSTT